MTVQAAISCKITFTDSVGSTTRDQDRIGGRSFIRQMGTTAIASGRRTLDETGEQIELSDVVSPSLCFFRSVDNAIEIGLDDGDGVRWLLRLFEGEEFPIPLNQSADLAIHARAASGVGSAELRYWIQ